MNNVVENVMQELELRELNAAELEVIEGGGIREGTCTIPPALEDLLRRIGQLPSPIPGYPHA